jgi:hypothetical protein
MRTRSLPVAARAACALVAAIVLGACGSQAVPPKRPAPPAASSATTRAASISLQDAMTSASRAFDAVEPTQSSVERLGTSLQPPIAQTGDAVTLLSADENADVRDALLLRAAKYQRTFLQFAARATSARTSAAAHSALMRSRRAGRRASDTYEVLARTSTALAGMLPTATAFNTGRLRDAQKAAGRAASAANATRPPAAVASPPAETAPTPSGETQFNTGQDAGQATYAVACSIESTALWCWTPNDGFTVALPSSGRPARVRSAESANRGNQSAYGTLGFGERWQAGPFSCVSRKSGLTCSNAEGHGWTLPRYRGLPAYF